MILTCLSEYLYGWPNPPLTVMETMLVNSGFTHKAFGHHFDAKKGPLDHANCTSCEISEFDGYT